MRSLSSKGSISPPRHRVKSTSSFANAWPSWRLYAKLASSRNLRLFALVSSMDSPFETENHHTHAHQQNPRPFPQARTLAQKEGGEEGDEHQAQLVDRRDLRRLSDLQRPKVADPRSARRQSGEDQEGPRLRLEIEGIAPLPGEEDEPREGDQDDDSPNERREIGFDALQADLGEDRRERGEDRR